MKVYFELFIIFVKVGAVTFGGGYSMLPVLQKEIVANKGWLTTEDVMDYYAISQCTPGIIAVNTSVLIGYHRKKLLGAMVSALGLATPSVIIILLIAAFLQNFMDYPLILRAFNGIAIAVVALIAQAVIALYKKGVVDKFTFFIFSTSLIAFVIFDVYPIFVVISSAALGILSQLRKEKR